MKVTVKIPIPFYIPITNDGAIVSHYEFAIFKTKFRTDEFQYRVIDDEDDEIHQFRNTIAEVEYWPSNLEINYEDINDLYREAVVNSLEYLNRLIDTIRYQYNDYDLYNITIMDLPEVIEVIYNEEEIGYVTAPLRHLKQDYYIDKDGICNILKNLGTWDIYYENRGIEKFFELGKYHLYREEFMFAIVEFQTSFEIFIANTIKYILLKENHTENHINKVLRKRFRDLIEIELAGLLGTNLSFDKNPVINQWHKDLYKLRNAIVHSGKDSISGNEAYSAYDAYVNARNYISDLLVEKEYLSIDGKIDLKLFRKNLKGEIDADQIYEKLIEKEIIPNDLKRSIL